MTLPRRYTPDHEQLLRTLIFAEEDRHLFTREQWSTGFRWYRTPNVVCLEHYRPFPPAHHQARPPIKPAA
jgi:hypothetical protein